MVRPCGAVRRVVQQVDVTTTLQFLKIQLLEAEDKKSSASDAPFEKKGKKKWEKYPTKMN